MMRGQACWSDHFMIRGKVKLVLPRLSKEDHVLQCAEKSETYKQKLDCIRIITLMSGSIRQNGTGPP